MFGLRIVIHVYRLSRLSIIYNSSNIIGNQPNTFINRRKKKRKNLTKTPSMHSFICCYERQPIVSKALKYWNKTRKKPRVLVQFRAHEVDCRII